MLEVFFEGITMQPKLNRILTRSFLGAVIVFFLMPFSTLTCGGAKLITMNGVQLATGTTLSNKNPFTGAPKQGKIKPEPLAAAAGVAAVLALLIAFIGGNKGKIGAAVGSSSCALLLLLTKFKVDQNALEKGQGMVGVQWEFGFWLALLAAITAAVIAFIPDQKAGGEIPKQS